MCITIWNEEERLDMSDPMVLAAQKWVNATYQNVPGYSHCIEDGLTGWDTIDSLIMGLQSEFGISPVTDAFGPSTYAHAQAHGDIKTGETNHNLVKLVQSAMYCKGYDGSSLSGTWDARTIAGVKALQQDIGYSSSTATGRVSPKLLKALMNMDAFVLIDGGSTAVRSAQQWLNLTYINRQDFFYLPCDGYFSRGVQTALVYGIQYEIGMADGVANGNVGPGTQAGLKTADATLTVGKVDSTKRFVRLFQAAMIFNQWPVSFNGTYSQTVSDKVKLFQGFAAFPTASRNGIGDFQTWMELLVSTGDPSRPGTAADMASTITAARAQSLVAAGYKTVGRYLTNYALPGALDKKIKPGEITTILGAGLTLFPIFEEGGDEIDWFTTPQGITDAHAAHDAATAYGIPAGTVIYFAVDFDATAEDVEAAVLPYFRGVQTGIADRGGKYVIGIYGSRNVCSTISAAGLSARSFVGGMSTGFSGNLGFPLPKDWSFNQIAGETVGSGTGAIEIDKNIKSGRDNGVTSLTPTAQKNAAFFKYLTWVQQQAKSFYATHHAATDPIPSNLVAHWFRHITYGDPKFTVPDGPIANAFITQMDNTTPPAGTTALFTYIDPGTNRPQDADHFAAAFNGVTFTGVPTDGGVNVADIVGWAGDLISTAGDYRNHGGTTDPLVFGKKWIGTTDTTLGSTFGLDDLIQDVDGMNMGLTIRADGTLPLAGVFQPYYSNNGTWGRRYSNVINARFGGTSASIYSIALQVFTQNDDAAFDSFRRAIMVSQGFGPTEQIPTNVVNGLAQAFRDVLVAKANAQG
jgi:peptidoglycan hydrolase-like protein with peptidoglycan-binding domain